MAKLTDYKKIPYKKNKFKVGSQFVIFGQKRVNLPAEKSKKSINNNKKKLWQLLAPFWSKLDRIGPVDNRPSTN